MSAPWEHELIRANFIEVCDRLEFSYESAIDFDLREIDELGTDDLRDLAFGVGYVRGLADAWDCTALQVVDEVLHHGKD